MSAQTNSKKRAAPTPAGKPTTSRSTSNNSAKKARKIPIKETSLEEAFAAINKVHADPDQEELTFAESDDEGEIDDSIFDLPPPEPEKDVITKAKEASKKHPAAPRGVIYLGRVPRGFYEQQIRRFFSQYGKVTRFYLARSKKTGRSKHYAFVEFENQEVAKIVAQSMNNYILFEHVLKCEFVPEEKVHPDLFAPAKLTYFKKVNFRSREIKRREAAMTPEHIEQRTKKLRQRDNKLRQALASKGVEYTFPGYHNDADSTKKTQEPKTSKSTTSAKTGKATVAPKTVVPKEAVVPRTVVPKEAVVPKTVAPKAKETAAPKAKETAAPKAKETAAPKAKETATPKAVAPKTAAKSDAKLTSKVAVAKSTQKASSSPIKKAKTVTTKKAKSK